MAFTRFFFFIFSYLLGLQAFAESPSRASVTLTPANRELLDASKTLRMQFEKNGSLKSPSPADAKWINESLRSKISGQDYKNHLKSSGWNSSGGGGGRACFETAKEARLAWDSAGRMRRDMIPRIRELVPYDYYSLTQNDYEVWTDSLNGHKPLLKAVSAGEDSASYLRRNAAETYGILAPVLAETLLAVLETLNFNSWQPHRGRGLPYYPDLANGPTEAVKDRKIPMAETKDANSSCVYVQLAIRYGGQFSKSHQPVQIVYDADLIERMRQLSGSEEDFIQKISILILHESLYFMVKRTSPYNGEDVIQFIKDILFDKFDAEYFRYSYFSRGRNLSRFMSLAMAEDYEKILFEDSKTNPKTRSRLILFRAWYKHVFNAEILEWAQNAKEKTLIPYFGWTGLEFQELEKYLTDPQAQIVLNPEDAMASVLVSLGLNGVLSSPESAFSRLSSEKNEIERICNHYGDFTNSNLLTQIKAYRTEEQIENHEEPVITIKSTPAGIQAFFSRLRQFCQSSTGRDQTADKKFP